MLKFTINSQCEEMAFQFPLEVVAGVVQWLLRWYSGC